MVLLLDIDGVMVPANSWRRPEILADGFVDFDSRAIRALNKILASTEVEVLLTTSHKFKYSLEEWNHIFQTRNISINNITRLPDNIHNLDRKNEILNWFNLNAITDHFIILDDDKSLNALPVFLKSRLVQTNASVGLTDALADDVIALINEEKYVPA